MEHKIVDREGRVVPLGVAGEICIRGFSVMREYWNEKRKTDEVAHF